MSNVQLVAWTVLISLSSIPWTTSFIWNLPTYTASSSTQTQARRPSNISISIGNRYNTQALIDMGTNITGLTITLNRWSGDLSLSGSGNQLEITSTGNDSTVIRVGLHPTPASLNDTENTIEISNSTIPTRRRREAGFLPTLPIPTTPFIPSIPPPPPIPSMNGNYISIDGNLTRLPDSVSNLTINVPFGDGIPAESMRQPWDFIQALIERRPSVLLDPLVDFVATQYLTKGKVAIDRSLAELNATEAFFYNIANTSLGYVSDQVSLGLQGVTKSFNALTQMKRTCVGDVPENTGRRVVEKASGCVRERLDEVVGIVDQFRSNVEASEALFSGWLIEMDKCVARNYANLSGAELDATQRKCYAQALVSPSISKLIDIPIRWASLALRINTAVNTFEAQIGLCVARVGLEVAAVSVEFGAKVASCALRIILNK